METYEQLDLFSDPEEIPLCHCLVGRRTGADGYTHNRNPNSQFYGMWVHARCGKPSHPHSNGRQIP